MKVIEAKIVVLGSQGVGKTSLVVRYIGKMFSKHISPTIGASFFTCNINLESARVKLQVWDTAGQERFRSMAPMYYRNANAALLVFDITSVNSFAAIKGWVKELQSNVPEAMVLSVVGNKSDLEDLRAVQSSEAAQFAASIGAQYCETSALHDQAADTRLCHWVEWLRSERKMQRLKISHKVDRGSDEDRENRLDTRCTGPDRFGEAYDQQWMSWSPQGIDEVFLNTAAALLKLSSSNLVSSLRSYDSADVDNARIPTGTPTEEDATHTGKVELPAWSIDNIAHGDVQKNMCC